MSVFNRVTYQPDKVGYIGLEIEGFLGRVVDSGPFRAASWDMLMPQFLERIVPEAQAFISQMDQRYPGGHGWKPELPAAQVECITSPQSTPRLAVAALARGIQQGQTVAAEMGMKLLFHGWMGKFGFPRQVYPDPRYLKIQELFTPRQLLDAMRLGGLHVHVGVESPEHARVVYNALSFHIDTFIKVGMSPKRKRIYRKVVPDCMPPQYPSLDAFEAAARAGGWANNLSNCWHLIRITRHGTVEVRVFGSTSDMDQILKWVTLVSDIARSA